MEVMKTNELSLQGVYLVIDPSMPFSELIPKLKSSLQAGVSVVQVWNHWEGVSNKKEVLASVLKLCQDSGTKVLVNNDWKLLQHYSFDGVHFDEPRLDLPAIKEAIGRPALFGVTCTNAPEPLHWAKEQKLDYVSFCSMFPSPSSNSCEIVSFESVRRAKEMLDIPVFLAGGITPASLARLSELDFDGIAIISGILSAKDPGEATAAYKRVWKQMQKEKKLKNKGYTKIAELKN